MNNFLELTLVTTARKIWINTGHVQYIDESAVTNYTSIKVLNEENTIDVVESAAEILKQL